MKQEVCNSKKIVRRTNILSKKAENTKKKLRLFKIEIGIQICITLLVRRIAQIADTFQLIDKLFCFKIVFFF